MKDTENAIRLQLRSLPEKPGVYRFYDESGTVIYVGKAKRLKRRVSSYFNKEHDSAKVRMLVSKVRKIETVVVDTEWDALLLENSMIKQFKPKYNILLKDDKTYPWIAVTKEPYPRIFPTRRPEPARMQLFGPYSSVKQMNTLLELIQEMFPLRNCKVLRKNDRPCMQYQIRKCAAPCCGLISEDEYRDNIRKAVQIIKGDRKEVVRQLKEEMMNYADEWKFEQAAEVKKKLESLENFIGKSVVVNPSLTNLDVFGIDEDDEGVYISFLRIVDGSVVQAHTFEVDNMMDRTREDALWAGILEVRERLGGVSPTLIVPFLPSIQPVGWEFQVPQRGDKHKLLTLAVHNAHFYMLEKKKRQDLVDPERRGLRVLEALQKALGMKTLPRRIECFDNSNTQGEDPVAAMSCFIDGKPAKKEYRHFNIKTVVGADDFASMEEVIYRRYHRLLEEGKPLPELVVIDGGKGQLNAAWKSVQALGIEDRLMMVGIAKRLEDIYKVGDDLPVYIDKRSEAQKLLQHLRDEVHRFGITHHRKRRSKTSIKSALDDIPGVGKVLKGRLLRKYRSVANIAAAPEEELAEIVGAKKAAVLKERLGRT
ncbi:MAG: excinuclease ABC subunit UvrC [Bacteroidales bacterium]|nr:excinuclease ABC subunit UvrC [Bacteroidales bacterium]MDY6346896.1 excinuclease ABC subunit UvrC [Bacteroidales bacterium]